MANSGPTNRTVNIFINSASAERQMSRLQESFNKTSKAIQKGQEAGKDMTKEIEKLGQTKAKIDQLQGVLSGKLAPTFSMLRNRVGELDRELKNMSSNAPGYAEKFKQFQQATAEFSKMKKEIAGVNQVMDTASKNSGGFWEKVQSFSVGSMLGNLGTRALGMITGTIGQSIRENAELSDSLADIQKTTGMAEGEVRKLNDALERLDTRTKTKDLRDIAIGLGQIGEQATPEAVAAIDRIVVALGDEFGGGAQEITTTLGILRNNLKDIKTNDYGADVLSIGNALNELGAQGLATAPVVVDFANRMAGVAGTFKVTSGQLLGLSATMQEMGINAERGSTAVVKIFQKIASEPGKFAKVAGMDIKAFVDLVNNDMLSAFNAVAVGAGKAAGKNTEFAKILKDLDADGSGAGEVLSKLAKNQEMLAGKIGLATTALGKQDSIINEFNTKNNNLAANLEKLFKSLGSWISNSKLADFFNATVKSLNNLLGKTKTLTELYEEQKAKVIALEKNIVPLISRYEDLASKSNRSKSEQVELQRAISDIARAIPSAITQFDKYGNAIAISTEKAKAYIKLQQDIKKVQNKDLIKERSSELKDLERELTLQNSIQQSNIKKRDQELAALAATKKAMNLNDTSDFILKENARISGFWDKAITTTQQKIQNLNDTINGTKGIIDDLTGNNLNDILKDQPKEEETTGSITSYMTEAEQKKLDELAKKRADFLAKVGAMGREAAAAQESEDSKEVQRVKEKYTEMGREAQELFADHVKYANLYKSLSEAEANELSAIYKKQFEKRSEDEYEATLLKVSKVFQLERDAAAKRFTAGEITEQQYSDKILQIAEDEADAKGRVAKDYQDTVKKAGDDLVKFEQQNNEKRVQNAKNTAKRERDERIAGASLQVAMARPGSSGELGAKKAHLEELFKIDTEGVDRTSAMYKDKQAQLNKELKALDQDYLLSKITMTLEGVQQLATTFSNYSSFNIQKAQNELDADRAVNEEKKRNLQKQLDGKKISQTNYNKQVERLDKEQSEKEKALKIKQFNAEKQMKLIQAGMDLASGTMNIWSKHAANPPLAFTLTAILGGIAALNIGMIAATEPPKYKYGRRPAGKGGVPEGPSHAQGGIKLLNGAGQIVGEMEGNEPILSVDTYNNNREIVDQLLDASMNNGGRRINLSWLYSPLPKLETGRAMDAMQFNRSFSNQLGAMQQFQQTTTAPESSKESELIGIMRRLNEVLDQGVYAKVYHNEFDKVNRESLDLKFRGSGRSR